MDKNTQFPECAKNCEVVKMLGVGECENVCGHKFDTSGRQLTIPDVINQVCDCNLDPRLRKISIGFKCVYCGGIIQEQTCL